MQHILESLTTGATLLLFFLVLTNPRKENIIANRWLAFFLICIFIVMLDDLLNAGNFYSRHPDFYGISAVTTFLIPPVFYLTIAFFTTPARRFKSADIFHFSVFLILVILFLPIFFGERKIKLDLIDADKKTNDSNDISSLLTIVLFLIQLIVYWGLSFRKLFKYQKNIRLYASSEKSISLQWLKYFLLIILLMIVLWIPSLFFDLPLNNLIAGIGFFVGIFLLSYFAIGQHEIFKFTPNATNEIKELIEIDNEKRQVPKKILSPDKLTEIKEKLTMAMNNEKPYLNSDLSLPQLSSMLNVSTHNLSHVINNYYNQNFFQFINHHRLEEAKRLLTDKKNSQFTIEAIGYSAGFNSKTVFNTSFKKYVGMTPTAYKESQMPSS